MSRTGSCHCGKITYSVQGDFESVMECNCSHCSRKGYLLWFVPRDHLTYSDADNALATYTFNTHNIQHHFCKTCGCAPFGFGEQGGQKMAAVNIRCLNDVDLSAVKREFVDGKSF